MSGYILALALSAAGSAVAAPQQNASNDQQLASVKGVVTNSVTGERLRKAFVRLHPTSGNALPAATDEQGRFVFENLKPGTYKMEAEHSGFLTSLLVDPTGMAVVLRLAAGEIADVNLKLTPQAAISGRVVDSDGDAWVYAELNLYRPVFKQGMRRLENAGSSEIDDRGQFRVGGLAPGKYYVKAEPNAGWERANRSASEGRLQPAWYPDSFDVEGSTPIILSPGQDLSGVEIRLRKSATYRIRGMVSGLENVPNPSGQAGRRIWASSTSGPGGNTFSGYVSPGGSFEIQGVPSGEYEVNVLQGMPPIALSHVKVRVDDRDADGVSIEVTRMHSLKGTLRFEDSQAGRISGLQIVLLNLDSQEGTRLTYTRKDGGFDFPLVLPGRYRVVAVSTDTDQNDYLKLVRFEDHESRGSIISLTEAESSIELVLSTRGARIAVNVNREDAAALAAAGRVVLIPDAESQEERGHGTLTAVRDQSGAFSIGNIAPGTYRLFAFENVPDEAWVDAEFWKQIRSKGVELSISEGESKTADAPLVLKSEIAGLLSRLGME